MTGEPDSTGGMVSLVDLIDALAEPPEPAPVPLTPETWGWAVLAVLIAVLLALVIWRMMARQRANAYRRAALAALRDATTVAEIAAILRRAALAAWPRAEVAALSGGAWTAFLSQTGPRGFPAAAAAELRTMPYRNGSAAPSAALRRAAADWLRAHRAASRNDDPPPATGARAA